MFVDLTAAYDTAWHRGLTCKFLRLLLDRCMISMIMKLVGNSSFTITTGSRKQSRMRRLKNDFPQGSFMVALLFDINIHDLPATIARKFAYIDNLAILHSENNWLALKRNSYSKQSKPCLPISRKRSSSSLPPRQCMQLSTFTARRHSVSLASLTKVAPYVVMPNRPTSP